MALFSHSKIGTFTDCPLRYKYRYIDKVETEIERSIEAFMGSMVHEALEKLYKDLRFMKVDTLKELLDWYNNHWEKNYDDKILIVRKEFSAEDFRKTGEKCITDYYEKYKPFDQMKTVSIEQRILLDIFDDKRYMLQGYIDRLATDGNGTFEIHDYKTAGTLPSDDKVNEDRQLALYSIAIKKMYPYAKKIYLIWHYLRFNQEIKIEKNDDELENLKIEIVKQIDEINSAKEYPAKESILCDWCEFAPICPKKKHLFRTEQMEPERFSADDGVKLVTRYAELTAEKKEIDDELKSVEKKIYAFSEQEKVENIAGKGVVARIWTGKTFRMPNSGDEERDKMENIIRESGIWEDFSRLDTFALSKAMQAGKLNSDLIKKLAPFVQKDIVRRIYLKEKD
ncbi:MAG: PD-(D/E)XK nuclease family protein [Candidatus Aenigmarchaeota archaeon]|nr:PD-(D/E)XK nuclease family protein [Candidatus Aenigmarchaeota archaeon]